MIQVWISTPNYTERNGSCILSDQIQSVSVLAFPLISMISWALKPNLSIQLNSLSCCWNKWLQTHSHPLPLNWSECLSMHSTTIQRMLLQLASLNNDKQLYFSTLIQTHPVPDHHILQFLFVSQRRNIRAVVCCSLQCLQQEAWHLIPLNQAVHWFC